MQTRPLGRTGHDSTIVIAGLAAFWSIDQEGANAALDQAQAAGINHIDVAPQYGNAQAVLGPWLASRRDAFFLNCKTLERERDTAWADLHNSLTLLHTDVIDLYQFHAVTTLELLDRVTAPGGAWEAFVQARDEGLVRYLGITCHGLESPTIARTAVERLDLDAVMLPLNPRLYADPAYRTETVRLLDVCRARNVAVQVIKSAARGPWLHAPKTYNSWYEPYDTDETIAAGVRFALSQPGVSAAITAGDVRLWPAFFHAAETFTPLSDAEQDALIAARASDDPIFVGPQPDSRA